MPCRWGGRKNRRGNRAPTAEFQATTSLPSKVLPANPENFTKKTSGWHGSSAARRFPKSDRFRRYCQEPLAQPHTAGAQRVDMLGDLGQTKSHPASAASRSVSTRCTKACGDLAAGRDTRTVESPDTLLPTPRAAKLPDLLPQPTRLGHDLVLFRQEQNPHRRAAHLAVIIPLAGNFRKIRRRHRKHLAAGRTHHLGRSVHPLRLPSKTGVPASRTPPLPLTCRPGPARTTSRRKADTPRYCRMSPALFPR